MPRKPALLMNFSTHVLFCDYMQQYAYDGWSPSLQAFSK